MDGKSLQALIDAVNEQNNRIKELENKVTVLQAENERHRAILTENGLLVDLSVSAIVPADNHEKKKLFEKFVLTNRATQRKIKEQNEAEKMKILFDVFELIRALEELGTKNQVIFDRLDILVNIINRIKPAELSWTLTQWWGYAQSVTVAQLDVEIKEQLDAETDDYRRSHLKCIQEIVLEIIAKQEECQKNASTWSYYLSNNQPDVSQVKQRICESIDSSGFELCQQLLSNIRLLDNRDPARFLEDHCQALLESDLTENQQERLKHFVEAFVVSDEWVLVEDDGTPFDEPDWFRWSCYRVKRYCTLYGYNKTLDGWLDSANEYKSTCSRVKSTIEWAYFGGRLMVDPTGAVLSLLW